MFIYFVLLSFSFMFLSLFCLCYSMFIFIFFYYILFFVYGSLFKIFVLLIFCFNFRKGNIYNLFFSFSFILFRFPISFVLFCLVNSISSFPFFLFPFLLFNEKIDISSLLYFHLSTDHIVINVSFFLYFPFWPINVKLIYPHFPSV